MRTRRLGRARPPPVPPWERFSSCSSRCVAALRTPSPPRKSHAHIGPERLRMGRLRVDFVPARDAIMPRWALGPADPNALSAAGSQLLCCLTGGTTWLTVDLAPDAPIQFVSPIIGIVGPVVSRVS